MRLLILCFCIAVLLVGSSCRPAAAPVAVSNRPVSINDRATGNAPPAAPLKPIGEMTWTDEKGGLHKVSELKGKAVILDFWATFCPPCREEIPHLNSLLAKHGADNLTIVGMNVGGDEDDAATIAKFVKQTKLDYPIAHPDDALVNYVFAERDDIPQTLVLDRDGQVVNKFVGYSTYIQIDIDDAVEKALKAD
ncbi:MAG: TlpA family protein disulfide reductase [Pyrinomonadaceae bacterium]